MRELLRPSWASVRFACTAAVLVSGLCWLPGCGGGGESTDNSGAGATPAAGGAADGGGQAAVADMAGVDAAGLSGETPGAVNPEMSGPGSHGADGGAGGTMLPEASPSGMLNGPPAGVGGAYAGGGAGAYAGGMAGAYPGMPGGAAPAQSTRPAALDQWTQQDFESAVRERDEKVLEAIQLKVKASPGDAAVAALLTGLLATSLEAPQQSPGGGGYPGGYPGGYSGAGGDPGPADGGAGFVEPGGNMGANPAFTNPGAGYPGMGPADPAGAQPGLQPGAAATPPVAAPAGAGLLSPPGASWPGVIPRSDLRHREARGVDSVTAMLLEASVAYVQPPELSISGGAGGGPAAGAPPVGGGGAMLGGNAAAQAGGAMPAGTGTATPGGAMLGGADAANPGGAMLGGGGASATPGAMLGGTGGMLGAPGDLTTPGGGAGMEMPSMGYGGMPGAGAPGAGVQGRLSDRQLVEAIIRGLLDNGSTEAWQTIHGILIDQVKTPLTGAACSELITLELLRRLDSPGGTVQTTLTAILEGTAPLPAPNRSAALRMVAAASGRATDRLLNLTVDAPLPPGGSPGSIPGAPGYPGAAGYAGAGGYPAGYPGAAAGYAGAGAPGMAGLGGAMSDLPGDLAGGGGAELGAPGMQNPGMGMGMPGGAAALSGPPLPPADIDENTMLRVAQFVWAPAMVEKLLSQIRSASDLGSVGDLLTLAATIPQASVRKEIFQAFSRTHAAGANAVMSTGLFEHNAHDPALLVVLKALPRQRPPRNATAAQQAPPDSWTQASQQLVLSLRERLRRSAASLTRYDGAQPVRLHKNAIPEVAVVLNLPGAARDALGASAPADTAIYYTRTTFTPLSVKEQSQVAEHYEERAAGQRRADPQKGILWIDGVKTMSGGTRRTMDVIIQQAGAALQAGYGAGPGGELGAGGGGGAPGSSFTIEIIVVETTDPRDAGAGLTTANP